MRAAGLQIPAESLFALNRFEESFEVALSEAAAPLALDDLKEQRGPVLDGLREDLQHIALIVAIHQNAEVFQGFDRFVDPTHPLDQIPVISVGHSEKFD